MVTHSSKRLRVAVLGCGAIGSTVAAALLDGRVDNAVLSGVVVRRPDAPEAAAFPIFSLEDAISCSDLIVECAGMKAVRTQGIQVVKAGVDLLISSVGALADAPFRHQITTGGPGRCFITAGAMGGLDALSAASRDGGLSTLRLVTTKTPQAVVQPWMSATDRKILMESTSPTIVFSGTVHEAIALFPRSLNVAVTLALTTDLWDELIVTMVADPEAILTTHAVSASGSSGDYEFTMRHRPHPKNPATSGVVPAALLHDIERRAAEHKYPPPRA